ncbi:hypothetical protein, partial [Streptomyces sp. NP-1717]|uniref:hypothetical protein n=1 Tax=Streptomyces sp. NP-1717 TaxID=2704470 RepID=UPI001F5D7019
LPPAPTTTPTTAGPTSADHADCLIGEREHESTDRIAPTSISVNSPNTDRSRPSIAELARHQIAINTDNRSATDGVLAVRPDAARDSVAAAVRRERRKVSRATRNHLSGPG